MTDRKKPGVAFWATVGLVVALVGYPLSIGPAVWLYDRDLLSPQTTQVLEVFYWPMTWLTMESGWEIGHVVQWYAELWMK
jgi:hypothetical protein